MCGASNENLTHIVHTLSSFARKGNDHNANWARGPPFRCEDGLKMYNGELWLAVFVDKKIGVLQCLTAGCDDLENLNACWRHDAHTRRPSETCSFATEHAVRK